MRVSVAVTIISWESLATCMIPLVMFGYMFGLPRAMAEQDWPYQR
jgi:hypothetical protein